MKALIALLVLGQVAVAGEIRSDDPCVLAAVRSALVKATEEVTANASSETLEAGVHLDVNSQYSTKFERYTPQKGTYVVKIDAGLYRETEIVYEVDVDQSADLSCRAVTTRKRSPARD